jgi:hypothetical protein
MALLDLLDDLGKGAFLREKINLDGRRVHLGARLFFTPLKTWPIATWWPRAAPFAAALSQGLDRTVIRNGLSLRLFPATAVIWSTGTPRTFVATVPPPSLATVL